MRSIWNAILRTLDGAPQAEGQAQRGQSLLEMAFITPLLVIMVVGIVEIGWYANHFLILLEVTRVGARTGSNAPSDLGIFAWPEEATTHPIVYRDAFGRSTGTGSDTQVDTTGTNPIPPASYNYRSCGVAGATGFYNYIICVMLDSLDPLSMKGRAANYIGTIGEEPVKVITDRFGQEIRRITYPDDIIVSVFSIQTVNHGSRDAAATPFATTTPGSDRYNITLGNYRRTYNFNAVAASAVPAMTATYPLGFQAIVVGRYPRTANECNLWRLSTGVKAALNAGGNDPFDYIPDGQQNTAGQYNQNTNPLQAGLFIELEGYDNDPTGEAQLGFVWTAQHQVKFTDEVTGNELICYGSEWTTEEVEQLINMPGFLSAAPVQPNVNDYGSNPLNPAYQYAVATYQALSTPYAEQTQFIPSQGLILVEMFWQHELLLNFPFVSQAVSAFGDLDNIIISTWAAFPMPAAEPNIVYGLPN